MVMVKAVCPVTNQPVEVGVPKRCPKWKGERVTCPSCKREHIYIPGSGELSDAEHALRQASQDKKD